jgi:hypothetical protein
VSFPTKFGTAVEGILMREAQSDLGPIIGALTSYQFYLTNTTTPANVYQDGNLTTPFPTTGFVSSDMYGRFPPIYLDPSIIYAVTFNGLNGYTWTVNVYTPPLSTRGTSQNVTYGMQLATTGEVTIPAPNAGGTGISLTLKAGQLGTAAIRVSSTLAGQPAIIVNNSATTGAQTATFAATNKPGTATSSPAGWLPIQCDGTIYFTPIWHGNNFEYYTATPGAIGENINAASVVFNGNGSTTANSGTAVPSSWFLPNQTGIGASYYISFTPTPGTGNLSGMFFSTTAAPNTSINSVFTNITSGGLSIGSNAAATLTGTYQISNNSSGTPVVASGNIVIAGGNGPQQPAYNGTENLVLVNNGTATLNGAGTSNWYSPTTAAIGSGYYISVTQTGGTAGYSFTGVSTTPTAPSSLTSGLTIGITPATGASYFVSGTYTISTDAGGVNIVATGSITLNGGNPINSNNYSGSTSLILNSNGTTSGGAGGANWYSPTTAGVGSGYWIDVTRTGGTAGVNFSNAQGSWTNIGSGLTIGITGYTGDVGTVTASGTYQISSSATGSPVLGSGTISISISGLTVIHVYTTGSNATETVPTGSTTAILEVWGGGAGGTAGTGSGCSGSPGAGGGAGGYCRTSFAVSTKNGLTWKYTVGAAGAAGAAGGAGSIVAGTMTGFTTMSAGGGGTSHVGGTASGGTQANTVGATGSGRTGGTGTTGTVSGDGSPYGGGGLGGTAGSGHNGSAGNGGAAVFYYS